MKAVREVSELFGERNRVKSIHVDRRKDRPMVTVNAVIIIDSLSKV